MTAQDHRDAASFKRGEPVVGTTYFYGCDIDTNRHIRTPDGDDSLTTHTADMGNLSYKRASWHKSELLDMMDAGIDFVLPVHWGVPGAYDGWSFAGLPPPAWGAAAFLGTFSSFRVSNVNNRRCADFPVTFAVDV